MADFNSAGSVAGAVMETAGYVQLAKMLQDFEPFLNSAGALLYMVAIVGGIFSIVLFGSFRMGLHLLLAPGLFWFLITPSEDMGEVFWRVGGAKETTVSPFFRHNLKSLRPKEQYMVPWFFKFYTGTINELKNNMSDLVVSQLDTTTIDGIEVQPQVLSIARSRAIDLLTSAYSKDEDLYEMLKEGLFGDCQLAMRHLLALSGPTFGERFLTQVKSNVDAGQPGADGQWAFLMQTKDRITTNYHKALDATVKPNEAIVKFMEKEIKSSLKGGEGINFAEMPGMDSSYSSQPEQLIEDLRKDKVLLTCRQMFHVNHVAILKKATWVVEQGLKGIVQLRSASGDSPEEMRQVVEANRKAICKAVEKKLYRPYNQADHENVPGEPDCHLVEAVSIYLFRNLIAGLPYSRTIARTKTRTMLHSGVDNYVAADRNLGNFQERLFIQPDGSTIKVRQDQQGRILVRDWNKQKEFEQKGDKVPPEGLWKVANHIQAEGMMEVAYREQQRYKGRGIIQGIFSMALQFPYWQSVLLYFLCIIYPFAALLILIPGTAHMFLYFPLAWLWIKSWEVGFAVVMVLDRILWTLLPTSDLDYNMLVVNRGVDKVPTKLADEVLPSVLRAVFEVDPTYDVHVHYNYISVAMLAIPSITGYAILKAKSSILGSFVSGPKDVFDDATDMASGAYGIQRMNKMLRQINTNYGEGLLRPTSLGEGFGANGRLERSTFWGFAVGGSQALSSTLGGGRQTPQNVLPDKDYQRQSKDLSGDELKDFKEGNVSQTSHSRKQGTKYVNYIQQLGAAAKRGIEVAALMEQAEIKVAGASEGFEKRFTREARMWEAQAAGLDGYGGYELNAILKAKQVIAAKNTLWFMRIKFGAEAVANLGDVAATQLPGIIPGAGKVVDVAGYALPAAGVAYGLGSRHFYDIEDWFNEETIHKRQRAGELGSFYDPTDEYFARRQQLLGHR